MDPNASFAPATTACLNTTELLEAILRHLDARTLLLSQRVNHKFHAVITKSLPLRQRLFLAPVSAADLLAPDFTPNQTPRPHITISTRPDVLRTRNINSDDDHLSREPATPSTLNPILFPTPRFWGSPHWPAEFTFILHQTEREPELLRAMYPAQPPPPLVRFVLQWTPETAGRRMQSACVEKDGERYFSHLGLHEWRMRRGGYRRGEHAGVPEGEAAEREGGGFRVFRLPLGPGDVCEEFVLCGRDGEGRARRLGEMMDEVRGRWMRNGVRWTEGRFSVRVQLNGRAPEGYRTYAPGKAERRAKKRERRDRQLAERGRERWDPREVKGKRVDGGEGDGVGEDGGENDDMKEDGGGCPCEHLDIEKCTLREKREG